MGPIMAKMTTARRVARTSGLTATSPSIRFADYDISVHEIYLEAREACGNRWVACTRGNLLHQAL